MNYPCGKFGDCSFSRFDFIVQTLRHTDAAERLTVGVSRSIMFRGVSHFSRLCQFLSRVSTLTRDIDIAILSVCLSVCP